MPKIRNIIIFIAIALILGLGYLFLTKKEEVPDLIATNSSQNTIDTSKDLANYQVVANTLPVLLSIQDIKLDDSIFLDPSFQNLKDSSIILKPDGNEGRPNPFAPIGFDIYENEQDSSQTPTETEPILPTTPTSLPANSKTPSKTN